MAPFGCSREQVNHHLDTVRHEVCQLPAALLLSRSSTPALGKVVCKIGNDRALHDGSRMQARLASTLCSGREHASLQSQ